MLFMFGYVYIHDSLMITFCFNFLEHVGTHEYQPVKKKLKQGNSVLIDTNIW